jgi:hypothetical protein
MVGYGDGAKEPNAAGNGSRRMFHGVIHIKISISPTPPPASAASGRFSY